LKGDRASLKKSKRRAASEPGERGGGGNLLRSQRRSVLKLRDQKYSKPNL